MQQIMASIIIKKTVEIKRHFKSVTNLAKFKRYTAQNGTLILQNYMLNFLFLRLGGRPFSLKRGGDIHIGKGCEECERHLSLNFGKQ